MLIVGELINTSRRIIKENVERQNAEYIRDVAKRQVEAGANCLDVNCSDLLDNELAVMKWLVENVQAAVDVPLSIDTPNPAAMEIGLSLAQKGKPLANSITGEKERYQRVLPLVVKYGAGVVALCMDDQGMPQTAEDRLRVARELVMKLTEAGVATGDIYLDPLLQPVSTDDRAGLELLEAIRLIRQQYPGVHLICGLSNVSYGLPNRKTLNRAFMVQTMTIGMDAYILDPLDETLMGYFYASQALLGQDPFCKNYLAAHRKGLYQD
jgi:5-methyltetrahydrofolate--homocysteine methyltransferase